MPSFIHSYKADSGLSVKTLYTVRLFSYYNKKHGTHLLHIYRHTIRRAEPVGPAWPVRNGLARVTWPLGIYCCPLCTGRRKGGIKVKVLSPHQVKDKVLSPTDQIIKSRTRCCPLLIMSS